jgi:hypothetical protein
MMTLMKKPETIYISHFEKQIQDIPIELIFNLDEICAEEWTDCKLRGIIILHLKILHWFEFAIFRLQKYISCIAAISIVEDTIVILVVIHGTTNDAAMTKKEWRDSQHLLIRSNNMLYRTWEIFKKYITKIIWEHAAATKKSMRLSAFPVVLLLDNYWSQIDNEMKTMLRSHNVKQIKILSYIANLVQQLDLMI